MIVANLFAVLGFKTDKSSLKKADKSIKDFGNNAVKVGKKTSTALSGMLKGLGALASVGLMSVAIKETLAFSESVARLGITAKGQLGTFDEMHSKILSISDATGIAKEEVLNGGQAFVALTGNTKDAVVGMTLFAEVAQATASTTEAVAGAAAGVSEQLGIASKDFRVMFDTLIEGGKEGAVELEGMAVHVADLGSASIRFNNTKGLKALAQMASAFQLVTAAKGGNAAEAKTSFKGLLAELMSPGVGVRLKQLGGEDFRFDDQGNFRNYVDILREISDMDLNQAQVQDLFRNVRAKDAFAALQDPDKWEALSEKIQGTGATAKDFAKINANAAVRVSRVWNKAKNSITRAFSKVIGVMGFLADHVRFLGILMGVFFAAAIPSLYAMAVAGWAAVAPFLPFIALAMLIALAIDAIWAAFTGGESVIGDMLGGFSEFYNSLVDGAADAFGWVAGMASTLVDGIIDGWNNVGAFFTWMINGIVAKWDALVNSVSDGIGEIVESIPGLGAGVRQATGRNNNQNRAAILASVARSRARNAAKAQLRRSGSQALEVTSVQNITIEAGASATPEALRQIGRENKKNNDKLARDIVNGGG